MKKERIIWVSIVTVLLTIILLSFNNHFTRADEDNEKKYFKLFEKVYYNLQKSYIEKKESKDLLIGAINGMIKILGDPHTAFLKPKQKENLEIETTGEYGGLGIEIGVRNNKLTIISPIGDTPAERSGVKSGDKIIKINSEPVVDPDLSKIVKILRGKPKTKVTISIEREGIDELLDFTITREIIKIKSVKSTVIDEIGYIRLISFRKNAPNELKKVLKKFIKKNKVKGIILDLRNNPGGLLNVAVKITDLFIKEGLIVYTKPRKDSLNYYSALNKKYYAVKKVTIADDIPLVILVNGGSASASEIFSGAVKDHKRGILIGTKTFGKGSVQSVINLDDGYGLRYTTAYYYTPDGTKIHKKGIEPDIEIKMPRLTKADIKAIKKLQDKKLINKFIKKNKEPKEKEINKFLDKLKKTDINLDRRTVKRLIKREIYRYKKMPLYDLDFDVQLKMGLQILKSEISIILKKG